jgi:hypothetical protein
MMTAATGRRLASPKVSRKWGMQAGRASFSGRIVRLPLQGCNGQRRSLGTHPASCRQLAWKGNPVRSSTVGYQQGHILVEWGRVNEFPLTRKQMHSLCHKSSLPLRGKSDRGAAKSTLLWRRGSAAGIRLFHSRKSPSSMPSDLVRRCPNFEKVPELGSPRAPIRW